MARGSRRCLFYAPFCLLTLLFISIQALAAEPNAENRVDFSEAAKTIPKPREIWPILKQDNPSRDRQGLDTASVLGRERSSQHRGTLGRFLRRGHECQPRKENGEKLDVIEYEIPARDGKTQRVTLMAPAAVGLRPALRLLQNSVPMLRGNKHLRWPHRMDRHRLLPLGAGKGRQAPAQGTS